jgi:GNAT superfamily N-acetyltransferase
MIRQANELDILALAKLAKDYAEEANHHDSLEFDMQYAMMSVATSFMHPDHCFLVAVQEGKLVGFLWGLVTPLPWSPALIAIDNVLYIKPELRGKAHGVRLIRKYEQWAEGRGAKQVSISIASGITEDATCNLYRKLGYHLVGSQFRKEI